MSKKRDSRYFLKRLEREFPAIYSAYRTGKLRSVREAAIRAGLVRKPSRTDALKREWKKASVSEKREFLIWIKAGSVRTSSSAKTLIVDTAGRLTPPVASHLGNWLKTYKVTGGQIMKQIGFKNGDSRLAAAINGAPLSAEIVPKLAHWLARHGFK